MDGVFDFFYYVPFILGIVLGLGYVLLGGRGIHEIIYKYPHPTTVNALIYKDPNGACYRYNVEQVSCVKNEGKLTEYPLSG